MPSKKKTKTHSAKKAHSGRKKSARNESEQFARKREVRSTPRNPGPKATAAPATNDGHPLSPIRKGLGRHFEALVGLQARLRAPNGCPWDREQTHESLRKYLVEETYEVLDALESGDPQKFANELGDLLLQIVFHAQLAAEAGRFDIHEVIDQIYTKMVRRHPHVFGNVTAETSAEVLKNWEELKAQERAAEKGRAHASGKAPAQVESVLDGVPKSLPALLEAHQLSRRAANVGFDWQSVEGLFEKLSEEAKELRRELESHRGAEQKDATASAVRAEEELGDLLFVCVNLARFLGTDAEIALKKANRKFASRFRLMEQMAAGRGEKLSGLSADQLEMLWAEAKSAIAARATASDA